MSENSKTYTAQLLKTHCDAIKCLVLTKSPKLNDRRPIITAQKTELGTVLYFRLKILIQLFLSGDTQ